jgi:PAS domain S-box-containing protein
MPHSAELHGFQLFALDRVSSMLSYWDRTLICRYANRAYEDWFGMPPRTVVGMTMLALLGPELFMLNEPYIVRALCGHDQEFERDVPGPDGRLRSGLARYYPEVDDEGYVKGFVAEVIDVGALKRSPCRLVGGSV